MFRAPLMKIKTPVTCLFFFGISVRFFAGGAAAAEARPNIVVILADDLGIGDMSAYRPGADVQTPHLDRLAAEGMRFSR
ncbi:MAG: sulfatase-like hydrolase/transferase, partial [Verrucomicrobia bacterium]|nr:sulfatase-like hydrolase/transferase [Verrucomicrobiota bacterium]